VELDVMTMIAVMSFARMAAGINDVSIGSGIVAIVSAELFCELVGGVK
jgi:hypothetical protein